MHIQHTPDSWIMFHYSNNGTDVTYKILAFWDNPESAGVAHQISERITNIQDTSSSFIITDLCMDVFMCLKDRYGLNNKSTPIFDSMVASESHLWMRQVPLEHIRAS